MLYLFAFPLVVERSELHQSDDSPDGQSQARREEQHDLEIAQEV